MASRLSPRPLARLGAFTGGRKGRILASALDPLVSSGTMFLVQGAVLLSASKDAFATYSLTFSYVTMGQAVLSAMFGGPLVTLLGGLEDETARQRTGKAMLRLQLGCCALLAAVGFLAALSIGLPIAIAAPAALALLGLSFRDALRNVLAARLRLGEALLLALGFAGITALVLVGMFLGKSQIGAAAGLAALAAGALLAVTRDIGKVLTGPAQIPREAVSQVLGMATWSLPGAAVIWLQNSFYLTLLAINLNLAAVGEVSAARMLVMPILITSTGLLRLVQVQASRRLAEASADAALASAGRPALLCLAVAAAGAAACFAVAPAIEPGWLPREHPHLVTLAGAWLLFAGAVTARGIYSALYQAMGRYREIFTYNLIILPLVLAGIAIAPRVLGLAGAVLPMAAGELLLLALLAWRARLAKG